MTSSCVRLGSSLERLIEALLVEHQVLARMLAQPRLRAPTDAYDSAWMAVRPEAEAASRQRALDEIVQDISRRVVNAGLAERCVVRLDYRFEGRRRLDPVARTHRVRRTPSSETVGTEGAERVHGA